MSDKDNAHPPTNVDQTTCEGRMEKVHEKINGVNKALATIIGGVAVLVFVIPILTGILAAYAEYKFSVLEKQIDEIIEQVGSTNASQNHNQSNYRHPKGTDAERIAQLDHLRKGKGE